MHQIGPTLHNHASTSGRKTFHHSLAGGLASRAYALGNLDMKGFFDHARHIVSEPRAQHGAQELGSRVLDGSGRRILTRGGLTNGGRRLRTELHDLLVV